MTETPIPEEPESELPLQPIAEVPFLVAKHRFVLLTYPRVDLGTLQYDPWVVGSPTGEFIGCGVRCEGKIEVFEAPPGLSAPLEAVLGKLLGGNGSSKGKKKRR